MTDVESETQEATALTSANATVSFDFEGHRRLVLDEFQKIRAVYESFARVVQEILSQALRSANVKVASIESRAKSLDSLANKATQPSASDPEAPKYSDPLTQIDDLAAARVITFFLSTLREVDAIVFREFEVVEKLDKSGLLVKEERLGYQSVHYVVQLKSNRSGLPEYSRYTGLKAEIQVRTVLQHAWAEIEHDIQYKSIETIPTPIKRRFMSLAGLLEIADREFQAVQEDDDRLRVEARASVAAGQLDQVEITGDALQAYLDRKIGPDGRMASWAYEHTALILRQLGFSNFEEIDRSISPYDDDSLSRAVHGSRQGQLTRFEDMIHAALGESFEEAHLLANDTWWRGYQARRLARIREAKVPVGHFSFTGVAKPRVSSDN